MRAISLWQPWASAMHLGVKTQETRSWRAWYTGDVAICASKRKMTEEDEETLRILVLPKPEDPYIVYYGCVLCVVELYDCMPTECFRHSKLPYKEIGLGDYSPGRWAWRTRNLRPLKEPLPIIGRQGLWILTPEQEKAVRERL